MRYAICIVAGLALFYPAHRMGMEANRMSDKATAPPWGGNADVSPDEFFGEDPREFAKKPENQALLKAAIEMDRQAHLVAGLGVMLILMGLWPALRPVASPFIRAAMPEWLMDRMSKQAEAISASESMEDASDAEASPRHSLGGLGGDCGNLPEPAAPGGSPGRDGRNLPGGTGSAGSV